MYENLLIFARLAIGLCTGSAIKINVILTRIRGKMMKKLVFLCFCLLLLTSPCALAEEGATLQAGIAQYQKENYEEAVDIFTKVRQQEPASPQAAFFLGMAYKQVLDYPKAADNLKDAVTLSPPIKEALVELIDSLYQMDRLDEAKKWLDAAEKENIAPARTSFLKGMILSKENKNEEAINSFENAKKSDPALGQAAEFQIGISYMKDRKLDKANERFQAVVQHDPLSDLAAFARQYQSIVEQTMYLERPLRLTIGVMAGYDTNIVSKPLETSAASNITDEKGSVLSSSARLDYVPKMDGPWLFNAQFAVASNVNSVHTHSHDSLANTFSISPGYNFGRFALNLTASYSSVLLRTDPYASSDPDSSPGYKRYLEYTSFGPTFRLMASQNNILELFGGYDKKEYFNQNESNPDSIRDAEGPRAYLSWVWLFKEDAFLNLRYDFNQENTEGSYWENRGHRLTANLSLPLLSEDAAKSVGQLNLQLTGSAFLQYYDNEQPYMDNDGNPGIIIRSDKIYTGSAGLTWAFSKYASFIAQYTWTKSDSNIPANTYRKDQYMSGFEFRL